MKVCQLIRAKRGGRQKRLPAEHSFFWLKIPRFDGGDAGIELDALARGVLGQLTANTSLGGAATSD